MLDIKEEKKRIYNLMRELIAERRELSKQYYEMKERLDSLDTMPSTPLLKSETTVLPLLEKEKIKSQDSFYRKNKSSHYVSFDRISKNILSILKGSPVPLNNSQILEKLNTEYELHVTYQNLSANILPKMLKEQSLPIEKPCRGYWQYRLPNLERGMWYETESEITYIFIRYVTVTLQRQANAFYKREGRIFSNESQLLIDSKDTTEHLLLQQTHSSTPDILLEKQFLNKQLRLSLFQLTDEELFIFSFVKLR